jgi:cytochrome P450 family 130
MTRRSVADLYQLRGGELWRDPWPAYHRLRDEAPVLRVDHQSHGEFWVLSRFDDVFEAVRDTGTYSSAQGLTPDAAAMAMFEGHAAPIVMMDPPEHTAMRRLVSQPMTPRRVATIEPAIRAFVDERLDDVAERVALKTYWNSWVATMATTPGRPSRSACSR